MTFHRCSRLWEVEGARDARLSHEERVSWEEHAARCSQCRLESERLEELTNRLRAARFDVDEVSLRRLRQRTLESADAWARLKGEEQRPDWRARALMAVAFLVLGALLFWRERPPSHATETPIQITPVGGATWERRLGLEHNEVDLFDGELRFVVRRQPDQAPLVVHVPDGDIEDRGTIFSVTVAGGHTLRIDVEEGAVAFRSPGRALVAIGAPGTWSAASVPRPNDPSDVHSASSGDPVPPAAASSVPITSVRPRARASHPADATATVARKESRDEDEARNAEDAEYVRIIALLKESRIAEARALSEDYLRRFPDGFRRKEVEGVARR